MGMTIIMIAFYIVLAGFSFVVGRWLENHEKGWKLKIRKGLYYYIPFLFKVCGNAIRIVEKHIHSSDISIEVHPNVLRVLVF